MQKKSRTFNFGLSPKTKILIICGGLTFVVVIIVMLIILSKSPPETKTPPGPPTSVILVSNSNTKTITNDLITGGSGSKDGVISGTEYRVRNNGGDNILVLNIKYPVTKDKVYQVSITAYPFPPAIPIFGGITNEQADKNNKAPAILLQWDGTFVMDDLQTPASVNSITIPPLVNSSKDPNTVIYNAITYTYNTKWLRASGDTFTIAFKSDIKEAGVAIASITITPLS